MGPSAPIIGGVEVGPGGPRGVLWDVAKIFDFGTPDFGQLAGVDKRI